MALSWGWLSDGPLKGARWPFIYAGAIITVSSRCLIECRVAKLSDNISQMVFHIVLLKMPLYTDITGRMIVYWFANIGVSSLMCTNDR